MSEVKCGDRVRYIGVLWPEIYGAIGTVTRTTVYGNAVAVNFHISGERKDRTTWAMWLKPLSPLELLAESAGE